MCGRVSSFVITVEGNVQAEVFGQVLVSSEAKEIGVVAWENKSECAWRHDDRRTNQRDPSPCQ